MSCDGESLGVYIYTCVASVCVCVIVLIILLDGDPDKLLIMIINLDDLSSSTFSSLYQQPRIFKMKLFISL